MNVAIIGAGPAGITAGYELSKNNISVDIFESSSSVGGMSKTIELWNQKVDIGSHRFFSTDKRVNDLWLEVIKDDYEMVNRLSRIYYNNNFFHYPIKAFDALSKLGILESFLCIFYYFIELFKLKKEHTTFEEWVTNKFGKRLYEIFFKTYTEKLWGIPCNLLDSDFASQRIKKFTLGEAIKTAILGNKNSHKTLVDQFAYPHDGTGILYERMKDYIESKGNNVYLNTPVNRVITKNNVAFSIELDNNQVKEYDYIISSMPLNILVSRFTNTPDNIKELSSKLKFRSTILVYLNVQGQNLFPDNWIYVPHSTTEKLG
jgi:protoporphyrinogen oxidase